VACQEEADREDTTFFGPALSGAFSLVARNDRSPKGMLSAGGFAGFSRWIANSLGTESADFACANFTDRKIAFIHAKDGDDHSVSASALHIIVAQAQKNLSLISRGGSVPKHIARWNRESKWAKTNIRRWRLGAKSLPTKLDLWKRIRSEILDHPDGKKEVWLVLGRTLDKAALLDQLQTPPHRSAITGQVVHLLSLLQANCAQLQVVLRVFCH
jgi:hypothetical protein